MWPDSTADGPRTEPRSAPDFSPLISDRRGDLGNMHLNPLVLILGSALLEITTLQAQPALGQENIAPESCYSTTTVSVPSRPTRPHPKRFLEAPGVSKTLQTRLGH